MPTEIRRRGVDKVDELISGQGETPVKVNESRFTPDEVILDPNSPLAVQIPEGVGADHSTIGVDLAGVLAEGHVEAKFGTVAAPTATGADPEEDQDNGGEHTPDWDTVVGPEIHNKPELQRRAEEGDVAQDVEAESPASSKGEAKPAEDSKSKASRADAKADATASKK